jgi:hypothetical protein
MGKRYLCYEKLGIRVYNIEVGSFIYEILEYENN